MAGGTRFVQRLETQEAELHMELPSPEIPGDYMNTPTQEASVTIQTSPVPVSAVPPCFGAATVIAHHLRHQGVLSTIEERVRFAQHRFDHYDVIDFPLVLLGYAVSSERTLDALSECFQPFAAPFTALFGRERLLHRSTLSRFLAALHQAAIEALHTMFLEDLRARPLEKEGKTGELWDRQSSLSLCQ
ncbi:hypothetical protein EPA93_44325 [Ktedonosporobacter rubrisoli]|uniref:Uncharacterized protein n=1 Tax=Ktedonosporobacter rubrisoli TaxID=2509675 RepID=A0A4P6K3X4_KTERU|nr:hypothetical protein [Ktedonosporobacter rubrisoli]QBD82623.1 hypothetical protein EPA93_44325 [Ktedonosporobacter rubrisoli]